MHRNLASWNSFYFDNNHAFQWVRNAADWERVKSVNLAQGNGLEYLLNSRNVHQGSIHFGRRIEHRQGPQTLREFFQMHDMEP